MNPQRALIASLRATVNEINVLRKELAEESRNNKKKMTELAKNKKRKLSWGSVFNKKIQRFSNVSTRQPNHRPNVPRMTSLTVLSRGKLYLKMKETPSGLWETVFPSDEPNTTDEPSRPMTLQTFNTAPVLFETFMSTMFAKIVSNLSTPCVQILLTEHQEVVVRCPKGVGIALEAKLNQYVLANVHIFKRAFRVNLESETFPDFFSNFKSADGQHVITQLDLKCGKNGCFDLSRLELLFKNMSEPGGVYKKLFKTMYIITFYRFDEHTGHVKPEPPVLKYIHELTGRSRTRINKTFEMMSIGGTSVNLRPTTCTINTYKDIGADRTRADFIEIILETLFSEHPRCQHIRKKISIKEKGKTIKNCRWEWHASIVKQVLELQSRGFVGDIHDSFKTNGIEHNTGLNHNRKS